MLYAIPFISALIGWFTNYIAIKMLFHPRKKVNLLLFSIQGIFPKRQKLIAERIANMVAKDLISMDEIKGRLADPKHSKVILAEVDIRLTEYINETLPKKFPLIGGFLSTGIKTTIKNEFVAEFEQMIPAALAKLTDSLEENFDLKEMVRSKVENFSVEKLEEILMSILKKEFKFIEILGAVIGFIIGCLQIVMIHYSK